MYRVEGLSFEIDYVGLGALRANTKREPILAHRFSIQACYPGGTVVAMVVIVPYSQYDQLSVCW